MITMRIRWQDLTLFILMTAGIGLFAFQIRSHLKNAEIIWSYPKFPSCLVPTLNMVEQFFDYLERPSNYCKTLSSYGGNVLDQTKVIDGNKMVCTDTPSFQFTRGNCTVLSFGIGSDWSFDEAMVRLGCKVYSFDPTIGFKDHARSSNHMFFNLGLGDELANQFPMRTESYSGIIYRLGLENKQIDYLKMDIEGRELSFYEEIFENSYFLLKNVRQIGMEIHPMFYADEQKSDLNEKFLPYWKAFYQFECAGFRLVYSQGNFAGFSNIYFYKKIKRSSCYEVLWVNTN